MDLDYKKLGFRAGIEIHQELNTKKLFCNCSTAFAESKLEAQTKRKIRAVAGETGKFDDASVYEHFRDRDFIYNGYEGEYCLVDLDEEPPHPVDREAFDIALGVAKVFRLRVPDTICVMRKTVTDGSAVSGFQRTMLIGIESNDSIIETSKGKVKIVQLNLEEDACKIIEKKGSTVNYSLSRLGIPLLEIGTDASIKDPAHFKEVAKLIGSILRSFNVKRGIGTIRQDVNVSIRGGARIEVKGWQDLRKLEDLVKNEVLRQHNLLQIRDVLKKRGTFSKKSLKATDIFKATESKLISELIKDGGEVYALLLPRFGGLLKREICPGKTFGKELAEYAIAFGTKGMIHTDEDLKKYRLEKEFARLRKQLRAKDDDLVLIVAQKDAVARKAIDSVYERASYCLIGVPEETRIPNHIDATNSYARPLPGAHRLYPETDIPNIEVTKGLLAKVKIPELLPDRIRRYARQYNVDEGLARELVEVEGFESYAKRFRNLKPSFIAHVMVEMPKEIKKRYNKELHLDSKIEEILAKADRGEISNDAVFEILVEASEGRQIDFSKYTMMPDFEIEKVVKEVISKDKDAPLNAVIGQVMAKLRGKAPGKKIVDIVKRAKN